MTSIPAQPVHHYSAEAAPRGFLSHLHQLVGYPAVIVANRGLIWNFFRRELLGRFRGSFLGIFWVLIQPMFLFCIYFLVFGFLFAPARSGLEKPSFEFAIYLFGGIIVFTSFNEATSRACSTILENGNLVKKVAFPCELLPIPNLLVSLMVYLVGAGVLLSVGIYLGVVQLDLMFLVWPLVLLVHAVFCLGVGLFLACINVFMRDTVHLYTIFCQAWFFLSPVFWPMTLIEGKLPEYAFIFRFNPLYPLIMAHRQVLGLGGSSLMTTEAGLPVNLGLAALWALGFLVIGYVFFMSRKRKFADLV